MSFHLRVKDGPTVTVDARGQGRDWSVQRGGERRQVELLEHDGRRIVFVLDGAVHRAYACVTPRDVRVVVDGCETVFVRQTAAASATGHAAEAHEPVLRSPVPGRVLQIKVEPGAAVEAGDVLVVIEAMKMETPVVAPADGRVTEVHVASGDLVEQDQALVSCRY